MHRPVSSIPSNQHFLQIKNATKKNNTFTQMMFAVKHTLLQKYQIQKDFVPEYIK